MFKKQKRPEELVLPKHVGVIMDGNGRWAVKRHLPRSSGHIVGAKTFQKIAEYAASIGIEYLTAYAFSTENWKRPKEEVDKIMELMKDYLSNFEKYRSLNMRVKFLGDLTVFDDDMKKMITDLERESANCTGLHLNIAINYGGRHEITHAVHEIGQKIADGSLSPDSVTEELISDYLYTKDMPDVDLIIRPSGEYRLSNFLIWQSAYAEYVFMDNILWPDFSEKDFQKAIEIYSGRNRRFGGV